MRSIRLLSLIALLLPTVAQAQVYSTYYGMPTSGVTRAAFVQMVMSQIGGPLGGTNCFKDVTTQSFAPAVCAAKARGIVTGDASSKFRPNDAITFVEAAAVAVRAEGGAAATSYDVPWYRSYLSTIEVWRAFPKSVTNILYPINLSQAQELITNVFSTDHSLNQNSGPFVTGDDNGNVSDDNSGDDVRITVDTSDSSPHIDDVVTYVITLHNEANHDLNNLDVSAHIDSRLDYVSSTDGGEYGRDRIDWDNIDIGEGDTERITLKLRVSEGAEDGDDLTLRVSADESDVRTTVTVDDNGSRSNRNGSRDLDVSVTGSSDSVDAGDTITYKITLTNDTNRDIRTDVRASLDNDMFFISASTGGDEINEDVVWHDVLIREGRQQTLTVKVRISDSADNGTVLMSVRADGRTDSVRTDVSGNTSFNSNDGNVSIDIADSPDPVEVGEKVKYTIRLTNNDSHDSKVNVYAHFDPSMSFYSVSNPGFRYGDGVRWDGLELSGDTSRTLTVIVRVGNSGRGHSIHFNVDAGDSTQQETTRVKD